MKAKSINGKSPEETKKAFRQNIADDINQRLLLFS